MTNYDASGGFDPYRYGPPAQPAYGQQAYGPPQPAAGSRPTGKQILVASWRLLKQDRELIWLPVISMVLALFAFAIFFVPSLAIAFAGGGHSQAIVYVGAFVGGFVASAIAIFFQAALVAGAYQRADGFDPTLSSTLAVAWRLKKQVLGWAVFTSIVGTVIRAVEQRLGLVGRILGFLGGIAWAIATFFVVPVIVAEGLGPIDALKRSSATIRQMWGTSVRTTLRFGLIQFALIIGPLVLLFVGIGVAGSGNTAAGVALAVLAGVVLIGMSVVFGAISIYARSLIFRWTTGRQVPGIDPALFAGAFAPRRGRW